MQDVATWETARGADGPKLAAFIERVLDGRAGSLDDNPTLARRVRAWKAGDNADFYTADKWLCELGVLPFEAPEDVWLLDSPRSANAKRINAARAGMKYRTKVAA